MSSAFAGDRVFCSELPSAQIVWNALSVELTIALFLDRARSGIESGISRDASVSYPRGNEEIFSLRSAATGPEAGGKDLGAKI
jgi:hypothetical protein